MRDFSLKIYKELLSIFRQNDYEFLTYADYCSGLRSDRMVVLRHDVDLKPVNSLATAKIENGYGIKAVYYFRAVPESWDEDIIRAIAGLGHEIGYHYESLTTCNGDIDSAFIDFCQNLENLRKIVPVSTICMHGSPKSPYDSKNIWGTHSYKELGIVGEPYLDTDFSRMFYITDTGRRWDGYKVSVRDKIPQYQDKWTAKGWVYHSSTDIIKSIDNKVFPLCVMMTTHPQRWTNCIFAWYKELIMQNAKNFIKRIIVK